MAKTGIGVRPENRCHGTSKKTGERCKAAKVILVDTEGQPIRYRLCLGHLCAAVDPKKIKERHGFDPRNHGNKGGGRPRKPTALDVLRHKVEQELGLDKVLEPYIKGLDAERALVVGNGPKARIEMAPDTELAMKATDRILDRIYGKPRQAMELTGSGGGPISVDIPTDEDRQRQMAQLLAMTGALGTVVPPVTSNGHSNGHVPEDEE